MLRFTYRSTVVYRAWLIAAVLLAVVCSEPAFAQSPFAGLDGAWSGPGQVRLENGSRERLSCRAYYTPKDGGAGLGMAIRCASQSYSIEVRSTLRYEQGKVTGSWEERTFNASGSLSGRASGGNLTLTITGGVSGTMSVALSSGRQTVSIATETAGLKGVSVQLTRG